MSDPKLSLLHRVEQTFDAAKLKFTRWRGRTDPLTILPFITYGTERELWLRGRVLEDEGVQGAPDDSFFERLRNMYKRYESDEIPGATVRITLGDESREVESNEEGYYDLKWRKPPAAALERPWTEARVTLLRPEPDSPVNKTARVSVPAQSAELAVVSDVDDTIVKTGATDFLRHARTVLTNNAYSREIFPGTADFYQRLRRGPRGDANNPFFYISSSPWNIFDLLAEFIQLNDLPEGPILLKDFGISDTKFIKAGHEDYKVERIERVLKTYPELSLVLIGDSGQRDAYVYRTVVDKHADRIRAVYVRDLDPDGRSEELNAAADAIRDAGVPFCFMADADEGAAHAAEHGLITPADGDGEETGMAKDHGNSIKDDEQYESLRDKGYSKEKAARIANTDREAAGRKGGKQPPYEEWTREELYERAKEIGIDGRSKMNKGELIDALRD